MNQETNNPRALGLTIALSVSNHDLGRQVPIGARGYVVKTRAASDLSSGSRRGS